MSVESKKTCDACSSKLKLFLASLAFVYFAKAFSGSYMKSSITQIERRFNIPSSLTGLIDGSFEIGNLLVIAFVSYFGAKLHRPRIIAIGCFIMAVGSFITALPHFFQGKYKYETSVSHIKSVNNTESILPCMSNHSMTDTDKINDLDAQTACEKAAGSSMWIYVFLGNMLRGIGETPIMPLGVSYLDDFSSEENTPFYLACIHTVGILGPVVGFMLGSFFSKIYVDIGSVDLDFIPSLKRLFSNSVFSMLILTYLVAVNGFIGMITFMPKYMEQIFGQSASKSTFLIGTLNLPAVAFGMITGGFVLKRFKLGVVGAARMSMIASFGSFCLLATQVFIHCDNAEVAGLTVSYQGVPQVSYNQQTLLSQCNTGCSCPVKHWDPVCSDNGLTYSSPCLAGCQTSTNAGKEMVFHNCTCVREKMTPGMNMSAVLGQCPRRSDCDYKFKIYMILSVLGSFISASGGTPGYIVVLRSIHQDLKSLALGMQTLIVRTLGGIPPPIYFGLLIDRTCLKWGTNPCGGHGACRFYDANTFRITFIGVITGLHSLSNILWGCVYFNIIKRQKKLTLMKEAKENALDDNGLGNGHARISIAKDIDRESTI
ncbi:solute carrier organic anion transporter family member 1C1-like isoform X2 [Channa argus]|uniref:solute carrier organic anion transporter family member 1C1-like isoform X2 n=1 Tax=Channa argus TaxID=215402 RepID=UPI0035218E27